MLFEWSQAAISIILEEIDNLKGRPAREIFKELGLEIKWAYLSGEEEKNAAEWFLSAAIACLGTCESTTYDVPEYVKIILKNSNLFTITPRIYCEQCGSYEIPYCAECGKPLECSGSGWLKCSCGAPFQLQCSEGHRTCSVEHWFIPTSKMYTMLKNNIHMVFKQNASELAMCIMGNTLHIVQPCVIEPEGVEIFFDELTYFSSLPLYSQESFRKFAVHLGEKCGGTCSRDKINQCTQKVSRLFAINSLNLQF